jgi:hypothetical protein
VCVWVCGCVCFCLCVCGYVINVCECGCVCGGVLMLFVGEVGTCVGGWVCE